MQMKNKKRFLALVAAAAMAIAPCSAFATDVSYDGIDGVGGQGTGATEGWVDKTYFKVQYPTVADGELDFIMDPQELIKDTTGETLKNHGSDQFNGTGHLFFETSDGTWTNTSKTYEVRVWSTNTVDISVTATISSNGSIGITTDSAFTGDEKPSIYMAVKSGSNLAVVDPSTQKATMSVTVAALAATNFKVKTTASAVTGSAASYYYDLVDPAPAGTPFTFALTGDANPNGNWKDVVNVKPTVDLVWSVKPDTGMQTVSATGDPLKWANRAQDYTFKVDLSAAGATSIKDVGVSYNGKVHTFNGTWSGGTTSLKNQGWAEITTDTITLKPGLSQYLPAGDRLFVRLETASGDKVIQLTAE